MTLQNFLLRYDHPGSIVLLEGKRKVLPADMPRLVQLGETLARGSRHILFRSGNADGADYYFSQGVAAVDAARLQVITPYTGHRQQYNYAQETLAIDTMDMAAEPEVVYQSKSNKSTEKLVDKYVAGARDRFSIKAAYILRDTIKVIGTDAIPPASVAIFYDDLAKPRSGGTGHTMQVCDINKVPWVDQSVWMEWV